MQSQVIPTAPKAPEGGFSSAPLYVTQSFATGGTVLPGKVPHSHMYEKIPGSLSETGSSSLRLEESGISTESRYR